MIQINLLPDVKKEFLKSQRERNLIVSVCLFVSAAAIAVLVILGAVMGGQAIQKTSLTNTINGDNSKIQSYKKTDQLDQYLTVQNQLSQISSLKNGQPAYSRIFGFLQQLNPTDPNGVALSQVSIVGSGGTATDQAGQSNMIQLQGTTANFSSLDVYKTTLTNAMVSLTPFGGTRAQTENLFQTVTVSQAAISQDPNNPGVSFMINVTFDAAIFASGSANVTVSVPSETTSDSIRNTPSNVFAGSGTSNNNANSNQSNSGGGQ